MAIPALEETVYDLKDTLNQFIYNVGIEFNKVYNAQLRNEFEMRAFKEEMRAFKDEVNEDRKRMNKQWGELANRLGTIVEDIVAPNIEGVAARYFGCGELDDLMVRRKRRNSKNRSQRREFDVIAVCGDRVIFNETKSTPRMNYVTEFIEFIKSGEFFDYFPEYRGFRLIPVFSSLYLPEDVVQVLTASGIYAMAMSDDAMDLLNFDAVGNVNEL